MNQFGFTGEDLQMGGHGNKVYYDEMAVNRANKQFKKYGMKVEEGKLDIALLQLRDPRLQLRDPDLGIELDLTHANTGVRGLGKRPPGGGAPT